MSPTPLSFASHTFSMNGLTEFQATATSDSSLSPFRLRVTESGFSAAVRPRTQRTSNLDDVDHSFGA